MAIPTTKEGLAAFFAELAVDGLRIYPWQQKVLKALATGNNNIMRAMLYPSRGYFRVRKDWRDEVAIVPNKLYYMSPTGVREVSNIEERPSRVVMTDQQMADRGLAYDAIRGGMVKYDPLPKLMGYTPTMQIIDDPIVEGDRKGPKRVIKKDYNTVGCRFLRGETSLHKVYTYKIRKGAKVHLGQELVARTDRGDTVVVVVVEIHKTPQDNLPGIVYKFIEQKVAPL